MSMIQHNRNYHLLNNYYNYNYLYSFGGFKEKRRTRETGMCNNIIIYYLYCNEIYTKL